MTVKTVGAQLLKQVALKKSELPAATHGAMSFYGYTTRAVGIAIASLVDAFVRSDGFSARHVDRRLDRVRRPDISHRQRGDRGRKAIIGALALYLDFIDLFLLLLQLFGRRRLD
jgi:FtsH-binding integral membrane protein